MQLYNGTNPFSPLATPSGYGIWPTPDCINTDVLSAGNLMTAVQSVTDRTNWLGHRIIDWRSGGTATYTMQGSVSFPLSALYGWAFGCFVTFSGPVAVSGAGALSITSSGANAVFGGATLRIGKTGVSAGHMTVESGSDITVQDGGDIIVTGSGSSISLQSSAHFSLASAATATLAGTTTQTGEFVKSGAGAVTNLRVQTLPSGGGNFTASEADIWIVPKTTAASRTWTPVAEPGKEFVYQVVAEDPVTQTHGHSLQIVIPNCWFPKTSGTSTGGCRGAVTVWYRSSTDEHRVLSIFAGTSPQTVLNNSYGALVFVDGTAP